MLRQFLVLSGELNLKANCMHLFIKMHSQNGVKKKQEVCVGVFVFLTPLQRCSRSTICPRRVLISSCCLSESSTFRANSSDRDTTCLFAVASERKKEEDTLVCYHENSEILKEELGIIGNLLTEFIHTHHHKLLLLFLIITGLKC